jgi:fucose 4-O-acetylase-like acetyltransferase
MTTARLDYADAFKFLALVGVIFAHLPPSGRFEAEAWAIVQGLQAATGWCVLGFFAVSGALFRSGANRPIGIEVQKRARRLLIPWLAFSLLYKVLVSVFTVTGLIKNAQPIPSGGRELLMWVVQPADPQLYFLLYLFLMQAFLLFLHRANARAPLIVGAMAFLLWLVFLVPDSGALLLHGASLQLVPVYFAFLTFGLFCGTSLSSTAFVCAAVCVVGLVIAMTLGNWLVAWQLVAPWVLLLMLRAAEGSLALKPFAYLGRFSGGVYVWHAPLIIGVASIASVALLGPGFAAVLATVVICFASSAVLGTWVNRAPFLRGFHI